MGSAEARRPRSAVQKGQHYKARTKKWLEARGYQVAHLERLMMLYVRDKRTGEPRQMPIKRDQFGSDLLAVSATELVFVQVKLGRKSLRSAFVEFAKFVFPPAAKLWIVVWEKGAREPDVIDGRLETGQRVPAEFALAPEEAPRRRKASRERAVQTGLW